MIPPLRDIKLMIATKSAPFSKAGWIFELKYDGARLLVGKEASKVSLLTRNQNDATSWFPEIVADVAKLHGNFIMDCEICAVDEHGRSDFEALLKRLRPATRFSAKIPLVLHCFDLLFLKSTDLRSKPLLARKEMLRDVVGEKTGHILYVQHIPEKGQWLFEHALQIGLEGVIGKKADSPYVGGRSRLWLKAKPAKHHEGFRRPGRGTATHPSLNR